MNTERKKKTIWVQCQECGEIYQKEVMFPTNELYVKDKCPTCGYKTMLNLGENKEDIYLYMNPNVDYRYF